MLTPIIVVLLRIILICILYTFLGWTIYTLWKDLRLRSQAIQVRKVPTITLIERSGMVENKEISFEIAEVTIGRDRGNLIWLDEDTISNRHALLNYRNGQWWIEDLLSTNGTYLNDEKVVTPTILITGDDLRIGNHFYEIKLSETK